MIIKTELSGYVLSGGKSRRMGTDKAFLLVQHKPMLKRMIDLISPWCIHMAISGQNQDYSIFKLELVPDVFAGHGPVSGLHAALSHSSTDWNLVVGVDLPFLNEELLLYLLSAEVDCDCIIPEHDAGLEPLAGLYNKRILPVLEEMIEAGDYKLMNMFRKVQTRYLNCNGLLQVYPKLFSNINRPEDFLAV